MWPSDLIIGDDDGVVVLPSQHDEEITKEAIRHDEMEEALLAHTQRKSVSPKQFYPFNIEIEKIYQTWKRDKNG